MKNTVKSITNRFDQTRGGGIKMDKIKEIMLDINIQKYEHDYNFKKKNPLGHN